MEQSFGHSISPKTQEVSLDEEKISKRERRICEGGEINGSHNG